MKALRRATAGCGLAMVLSACGGAAVARAPQSFLRATPIVEHDPAVVEDSTTAAPLPTAAPSPEAVAAPAATNSPVVALTAAAVLSASPPRRAPKAVLAQANTLASRSPEESGFLNAVTTYAYEPGGFFKVFTAPGRVTDLALEPGEELLGPVAGGDAVRWRLDVGNGAIDGIPQKHLFIRPLLPALRTNITVTTDRRTYLLDLESLEEGDTFMVAVRWTYPQYAEASASGEPARVPESEPARSGTAVESLHFDYSIETIAGKPSWKPRAVYDDGTHTYIRFDRRLLTGEAPALYVRERGQLQMVNYRVKGTLYIVDRLFRLAELRLGNDDDQDVVRLQRRSR